MKYFLMLSGAHIRSAVTSPDDLAQFYLTHGYVEVSSPLPENCRHFEAGVYIVRPHSVPDYFDYSPALGWFDPRTLS